MKPAFEDILPSSPPRHSAQPFSWPRPPLGGGGGAGTVQAGGGLIAVPIARRVCYRRARVRRVPRRVPGRVPAQGAGEAR